MWLVLSGGRSLVGLRRRCPAALGPVSSEASLSQRGGARNGGLLRLRSLCPGPAQAAGRCFGRATSVLALGGGVNQPSTARWQRAGRRRVFRKKASMIVLGPVPIPSLVCGAGARYHQARDPFEFPTDVPYNPEYPC